MAVLEKKMTITDIAKAAGVSKATVSRYLNGKYGLMSPDTRERIRRIIALSGYEPSPIARSLKSRRTMQVGVVIADISSPFSAALLQGVGQVLDGEGYMPLIVNSDNQRKNEEKFVGELIRRGVDGLLINTAAYTNPYLIEVASQGVPVVLCDRYVKDYNFDIVTSEKKLPTEKLLRHLKHQGFSAPFLFIENYAENSTRFLRRRAFITYLEEIYHIHTPERQVIPVEVRDPDATAGELRRILASTPQQGFPAIIAGNTLTAMHLLGVIKELGLKIPREIGVCGPDDWNWGRGVEWASLFDPGITTYSVDATGMGAAAARLLLNRIHAPGEPKRKILLPVSLRIKGSTLLRRCGFEQG
jgi:LacI family kdg operon repressor